MNRHWMSQDSCYECGATFFVGCSQTHNREDHVHVGDFELCAKCGHDESIVDKWLLAHDRLVLVERLKQVLYKLTHPEEWAKWKAADDARVARQQAEYDAMMKPFNDYYADCKAKGINPKTIADYPRPKPYRPLERAKARMRETSKLEEDAAFLRLLSYASEHPI